ncbi:MAG TPA: hypothetical protein VFB15_02450 [Candidatus Binataceae bacterium]|nr:hypothetical protein [Candidatus Binataceae bacterium]
MKRLVTLLATAALIGVSTTARAQDVSADAATAKVLSATISGTALAPTSGACTSPANGYQDQCESGSCICVTVNSATMTGKMAGKGTADLSVTVDTGDAVTDVVSTNGCSPFFGVGTTNTTLKKVAVVQTFDFVGTDCAASKVTKPDVLSGGFAVEPGGTPPASGYGSLNGTYDKTTGVVKFTLKGPIVQ